MPNNKNDDKKWERFDKGVEFLRSVVADNSAWIGVADAFDSIKEHAKRDIANRSAPQDQEGDEE